MIFYDINFVGWWQDEKTNARYRLNKDYSGWAELNGTRIDFTWKVERISKDLHKLNFKYNDQHEARITIQNMQPGINGFIALLNRKGWHKLLYRNN